MKKWIIRQYIALAEVFGLRVPDWMQNGLPDGQFAELMQQEASFTNSLKEQELADIEVPENLDFLIESRIRASAGVTKEKPSFMSYLVPVSAFAACAVLGLYLLNTPDWKAPEEGSGIKQIFNEIEAPIQSVVQMAGLNEPEKGDILLRPLSSEKARLSTDLTNALKHVAQGVVPDQYMDEVNFRLDVFNAEMSKPI